MIMTLNTIVQIWLTATYFMFQARYILKIKNIIDSSPISGGLFGPESRPYFEYAMLNSNILPHNKAKWAPISPLKTNTFQRIPRSLFQRFFDNFIQWDEKTGKNTINIIRSEIKYILHDDIREAPTSSQNWMDYFENTLHILYTRLYIFI